MTLQPSGVEMDAAAVVLTEFGAELVGRGAGQGEAICDKRFLGGAEFGGAY